MYKTFLGLLGDEHFIRREEMDGNLGIVSNLLNIVVIIIITTVIIYLSSLMGI